MSFDWANYLDVAKDLCGKSNGTQLVPEAKFRCAISRAYYGAYCSARNYLRSKGISVPTNGEGHQIVRENFYNSSNKTEQQIGENLNRLRIARNKADYNDCYHSQHVISKLQSEAQVSLCHSECILSSLKQIQDK